MAPRAHLHSCASWPRVCSMRRGSGFLELPNRFGEAVADRVELLFVRHFPTKKHQHVALVAIQGKALGRLQRDPSTNFCMVLLKSFAEVVDQEAPKVPPIPCTPKASRESSYPSFPLHSATAKQHALPPTAPNTRAAIGVTNPPAGVIQTRPATAPEQAPNRVGFRTLIHSQRARLMAPRRRPDA